MSLEDYLRHHYSVGSTGHYMLRIGRFTQYYGKGSEKATHKDVLKYIEHLRSNYELHPRTLGHFLQGVKIYFDYLLASGKRGDHPCSELLLKDKIDKRIPVDTLYSPEELEDFFTSYTTSKTPELYTRNKIIISLLIYQGLTVSEMVRLEVSDISLEKGEISIKGNSDLKNKSPKSRTLALRAKQVLLIYSYLEKDRKILLSYNKENKENKEKEASRFILNRYGKAIKSRRITRILSQCGEGKGLKAIKIRQSVIMNLLQQGNDTRVVQEFARHRNVGTTLQYRRTDFELLQKAIEEYHPLR